MFMREKCPFPFAFSNFLYIYIAMKNYEESKHYVIVSYIMRYRPISVSKHPLLFFSGIVVEIVWSQSRYTLTYIVTAIRAERGVYVIIIMPWRYQLVPSCNIGWRCQWTELFFVATFYSVHKLRDPFSLSLSLSFLFFFLQFWWDREMNFSCPWDGEGKTLLQRVCNVVGT